MKTLQIGNISFSEKGYAKFITLSKEEQTEKVYQSLSPKDRKRAEQLLKDIPHGKAGIDGRDGEEAQEDKREHASGGNGGHNPDKSKAPKAGKGK